MRLYDQKVNHLKNPLGFRMERCVFSWKVEKAVGKRQQAAKVVVAADENLTEVLYDSGFDSRADSLHLRHSLLIDLAHVELSVTLPFGCTATLRLPYVKEETLQDGTNPLFADVREGICHLEPGCYSVSYETSVPLKKQDDRGSKQWN